MSKKLFIIITLFIFVISLVGCGSSDNSSAAKSSAPPTPKEIGEMKQYLQKYLPKEAADEGAEISISKSTSVPGAYIVDLEWQSSNITRDKALLYARNFIFATYRAVYAENLPIIYSAVTINKKGDSRILGMGLGKKVADKLPTQTWSEQKMSPSDFESWMKENYNQNVVDGKTIFDGRCFIDKR